VVISSSTRDAIPGLPEPLGLIDLGEHRFKGLVKPERAFQVLHPALPSEFPPIASLPLLDTGLPSQLATFVGRKAELRQVEHLLKANRLLTLTGSGGVGKTRLAVQTAAAAADDHPDGLWFVDLSAISDEELVSRKVADRLGIAETSGRPLVEQLGEFLAPRRALLILDNCEHVLSTVAQLAHRLLTECPELRVLATSRERLGVGFEATYRTPSMAVPTGDGDETPESLADCDAVQLFVDRATLVHRGFRLSASTAPAVAAICRKLDGIPLAIELAAAKVAALSPVQIAARLDHRLRLLDSGRRAGASRHQTLRETIDWSFGLLDEQEKTLFARLSVFRGGFDIEAVEAICGEPAPSGPVEVLVRLVEKSLVGRSTELDRYGLLETLRDYAAEKLTAATDARDVATRHAVYFADLAEMDLAGHYGSNQAAWLDRLSREHDNLRAALRHSLTVGAVSLAGRIGAAAWPFWKVRGHISEGRAWLESVLADSDARQPPDALDPQVITQVLIGAADLAIDQGDLATGRSHLERARALADTNADIKDAAAITAKMASLPHKEGDLAAALALTEEALSMARASGDSGVAGRALSYLALLHEDLGDHRRASALADEAVDHARHSGNPYLIADAALSAGEIALNRDDVAAAGRLFEEASASAETVGLGDVGAWAFAYLGKLAVATGEFRRARSLLERSLGHFRELESPMGASWALCQLGRALQGERDYQGARRRLEEALELALEYVRPDVPVALEALGVLACETGDGEQAAVLLGAAQGARGRIGLELAPPEQRKSEDAWASLRAVLGAEGTEELAERGRAMTVPQAAAYVLEARRDRFR
jgi:non-specific serine/threonine protein kinase